MDWSAVRDFIAVAETGSLSAAARRLRVSQPTLSRRIAELEEKLGATLFLRTARGLLLTETGEAVLASARQMEEAAMSIERRADAGRDALDGSVRVTLTEGLGSLWLPAKLAAFHRRYPRLRIEVLVDNRNVNLVRREADIALRMGRPDQPDLIAKKVGELAMGLYGSKAYLAEHGMPAAVADLKNHRHIGFDDSMAQRADVQRLERMFQPEHIIHRSTSFVGHFSAAEAGIGLAMLDCFMADTADELVRVLPKDVYYAADIWLVTHAEIARSARIRAVFDFIAEACQADAAAFAGQPAASIAA